MIYFRVDLKEFSVESWIDTGGNYQDNLDSHGIRIEEFLEKASQEINRNEMALFLFSIGGKMRKNFVSKLRMV